MFGFNLTFFAIVVGGLIALLLSFIYSDLQEKNFDFKRVNWGSEISFSIFYTVICFLILGFFYVILWFFAINTNEELCTSKYETANTSYLSEIPDNSSKYLKFNKEDGTYSYFIKEINNSQLIEETVSMKKIYILFKDSEDFPQVIKIKNNNSYLIKNETCPLITAKEFSGNYSSSELYIFIIPTGSVI